MDTADEGRARRQQVAAVFDAVAGTYDRVDVEFFGPIAGLLVDALDLAAGEDVLDVGCGRGAVAFRAAERVGETGSVTGLDLSSAMIVAATAEAAGRGSPVVFVVGDAAEPEVTTGSVDVVAASLVVFFLPDPDVAVRRWISLVRPGGRLGLTTFGANSDPWRRLDDLFRPFLPAQMLDPRTSGQTGPFASAEATTEMVTVAGGREVHTAEVELDVVFDDVGHWERWSRSHGQSAMWRHVPDEELPGLLEQMAEVLDGARGPDGRIVLQQCVRVTTAHV